MIVFLRFFAKKRGKVLVLSKSVVPLHSQNRNNGSLAQLNRAFDYGSKGYRFESYRSHSFGGEVIEVL